MGRFVFIFFLTAFIFSGKALATNDVELVDKGWNRIDLGVLFPDWAKPSCEIYSLKNAGWWVANKILNSSQLPLYAKCREKKVAAFSSPSPTPENAVINNLMHTLNIASNPTPNVTISFNTGDILSKASWVLSLPNGGKICPTGSSLSCSSYLDSFKNTVASVSHTFVAGSLIPGRYTYTVWAVNALGGVTDSKSGTFCIEPCSTPTPTPTLAPADYDIPVLVLKYFPLDPYDSSKVDRNIVGPDLQTTGGSYNLSFVRNKVNGMTTELVRKMNEGSKFHGYKDSDARSIINYRIFEQREFLSAIPVWQLGERVNPPDHYKILKTEGFDICHLVNDGRVKEVWVWMYHNDVLGGTAPVESYQIGPYGGVGNGHMNLPTCSKTYTVYDYNYGRSLGMALEDHTHHIEHVLEPVDFYKWWRDFAGGMYDEPKNCNSLSQGCTYPDGSQFVLSQNKNAPLHCGWTHCPPNVILADCKTDGTLWSTGNQCRCIGYDWRNEKSVLSDCEDWKSDGSGEKKLINCHTWSGPVCDDYDGTKFKVWWMQNIPSQWWVWIGDFDGAKQRGLGLN